MHSAVAADLNEFIPQRGFKDCVIAALATVIGRSYDEVADALNIPINADTGHREVGQGVDLLDTIYPLLGMGGLAAPLGVPRAPLHAGGGTAKSTSDK